MSLLLLALACYPPGEAQTAQPGPGSTAAPAITELAWACDPEASTWRFEVATDAWSGGAWLWMASEPATWERHAMYSESAAGDGSADLLGVDLGIEADWRDAVAGSSSRFLCSEQDTLAFQITVYSRDGSEATDCARWGLEGVLEGIGDVPGCEQGI